MSTAFYETDRALSEYLLFHYGSADEILPNSIGPSNALYFPVRCVTECLDASRLSQLSSALDLGCAVGRSTFELARHCGRVVGVDYSSRFIEAAERLKRDSSLPYRYVDEGELTKPAVAKVPAEIDRGRVTFEQGDAQNLHPDLGSFDVVLAANLIDRLKEPLRCVRHFAKLVKSGGQLILTSPYTWLIEYTPKENWLGGFEREGESIKTLDTLKQVLQPSFQFSGCKNLPFLIREHVRKFQWSVAEASMWVRR